MAGISNPFAGFGPAAKTKFLILGSLDSEHEAIMNRVRSLNLEHVSPAALGAAEISRRPTSIVTREETTFALMRRWFFARKPDAGFVLTGFPATLLQAKVLDEWLEARNEALDAVWCGSDTTESLVQHYCTLGLLTEARGGAPV